MYQKICVFLIAFVVFANGIPNGFNLDDLYYTTSSNAVSNKGLAAVPEIFTTRTIHDASNNSFDYRPIPMLSFAIQHQLGGQSAIVSHFISVLIYAFICLLVFVLLHQWLGADNAWLAFGAAVLYTVHPLHTEIVDNIKNRDELLAVLFCMLSLLSFWKWYKTGRVWHAVGGVLLFIAGLLCKTTIIIYALMIPGIFYFFSDLPVKKIIVSFGLLLLLSFVIIGSISKFALPAEQRTFLFFENPMYTGTLPAAVKTATAMYILGWYGWLHAVPYPLSFYYGYDYVSLMHWTDIRVAASLLLYVLLAWVVIAGIRRKTILSFAALCYLVCILPFSNLLQPAPGMMAERFTFASTIGYCLLLAAVVQYAARRTGAGRYTTRILAVICICYATLSIGRNAEWKSSWVLYNHDIKHLQRSVKANMLYGEQVITKTTHWRDEFERTAGEEQQAYRDSILTYIPEEKIPFLRVLVIAPDYTKAMNNLALAYIHDDSLEAAKKYLVRACSLMDDKEDNPNTHYNLAIVYGNLAAKKGNDLLLMDSSIIEFNKVIRLNPQFTSAYSMLSQTYLVKKDTGAALQVLSDGLKYTQSTSLLYEEMANLYMFRKDTMNAISYYERGASVPQPDPILFNVLYNYYHSRGDMQKENYYRDKMNRP